MNVVGNPFPFSPMGFLRKLEAAARAEFPEFYYSFTSLDDRLIAHVFWDETEEMVFSFVFYHSDSACYCLGEEKEADVWNIQFFSAWLGRERVPLLDRKKLLIFCRACGSIPDLEEMLAAFRESPAQEISDAPVVWIQEGKLLYELSTGKGEEEGLPYFWEMIDVFCSMFPG